MDEGTEEEAALSAESKILDDKASKYLTHTAENSLTRMLKLIFFGIVSF